MITGDIKSKVDRIWDTMWSGGISNPLTVIEQLTYLLFIKQLDEMHTLKEGKARRTKKPVEAPVFTAEQDALRWSRFKESAPEVMFETVKDAVFPFIKTLGPGDGTDDDAGNEDVASTYSEHMKDAIFMIPTPRVLANVVDQLDAIDMADRDTKGDLYEYMLGKIASAGQNGQFRTPRHIIRLMVDLMAPTPGDVICDPACGTAGFLVAASEYLIEHHGDAIHKTTASRRRFDHETFHGYDFDNTMLRIGSMNMLLHGVANPDIRYKDSLAQADLAGTGSADDAERFSLILANPPFSGSLDFESTSKDLLGTVKTGKTELLFLALFEKTLRSDGAAAVIVPAGVLESDSKAHIEIRKMLVETLNLEAVIRLPHWVFKPYASVDTSILLFSKRGTTNSVWFYRIENDGFADDASKSPVQGSELSEVKRLWRNDASRTGSTALRKHRMVPAEEIISNNYDLCPPLYLSGHSYPKNATLERLDTLFDIVKGRSSASAALNEGNFPFITSSLKPRRSNEFSFDGTAICIPTVSATGHGHAAIRTIHLVEGRFDASSITAVLMPKTPTCPVKLIYFYLLAHKDELLVPLMRGATNKSLNLGRLGDLLVPILRDNSAEGRIIAALLKTRQKISHMKLAALQLESDYEARVEELRLLNESRIGT